MKKTNRVKYTNYFEEVYLGKKKVEISVTDNKHLHKLFGRKVVKHSREGINEVDLKKMILSKPTVPFIIDIDSFLLPFDL